MITLLRSAWLAHPDQRLGQLIGNACRWGFEYRDPFNVEDDEMWAALKRMGEQ